MLRQEATLIIPVYNGATTLGQVFDGLEVQDSKNLLAEIIVIDDCSQDESSLIIEEYQKRSSYQVTYIRHSTNRGLASTYNEGIARTRSDLFILMHQDILLQDPYSIKKITRPLEDSAVVAAYPSFIYTYEAWINNPFWQKVLFSRLVNKRQSRLNGKFDCIRKIDDLHFDDYTYRTAGEDFDFEIKLKQYGIICEAGLDISHLQSNDEKFSLKKLVKKEAQLAECLGVNIRRHLPHTKPVDIGLILFRPLLLVSLLIPPLYVQKIGLALLLIFSFLYTRLVFTHCYKDKRVLILPFVNIMNVIVYSFFFIKGYMSARQKL